MEESFVRGPWWGFSYENMEMSIIDYGIASVSFGFFYFSALSRSDIFLQYYVMRFV